MVVRSHNSVGAATGRRPLVPGSSVEQLEIDNFEELLGFDNSEGPPAVGNSVAERSSGLGSSCNYFEVGEDWTASDA